MLYRLYIGVGPTKGGVHHLSPDQFHTRDKGARGRACPAIDAARGEIKAKPRFECGSQVPGAQRLPARRYRTSKILALAAVVWPASAVRCCELCTTRLRLSRTTAGRLTPAERRLESPPRSSRAATKYGVVRLTRGEEIEQLGASERAPVANRRAGFQPAPQGTAAGKFVAGGEEIKMLKYDALPVQAGCPLQLARGVVGVLQADDARIRVRQRCAGIVEHVEEIHVETEEDAPTARTGVTTAS